jgi:NodT family efflux transporter outer membrane factor (OMF) lipoprotein
MLLVALLVIGGCSVAPAYHRPIVATPPAYKELPEGWGLAHPRDDVLRGTWWEIFGDAELNALEARLEVDNQNIAQSYETYMASRALVRNTRASLYPTVTATPSATHAHGGGGNATSQTQTQSQTQTASQSQSGSGTATGFEVPAEVSWQPDFFGKLRSSLQQSIAAAQVSAATLENVRLSERATLAEDYFQLRGQDALQRLYTETVDSYQKALDVTQTRFDTGIASQQDVVQAETNLRAAEASATAVRITRAQYEHAIAVLVGQPAGTFAIPVKPLEAHPPAIPAGLPSQLLERRPDIASAERAVAEANALIGVGKAAYYPTVTLTASAAAEGASLSQLLTGPVGVWAVGGSLAQTLIDHGARRATVQQYESQYRAAMAVYHQAVLTAFQEVEDTLVSSRELVTELAQQQQAADASARYLDLAQTRYETGVDTYLNVLTAQNTLLTHQQTVVTLQTTQMVTSVQLIAALGGGWDRAQLLAAP